MNRVTNYFDAQMRVPVTKEDFAKKNDKKDPTRPEPPPPGFEIHMGLTDIGTRSLSGEQLMSWYGRILDAVKQRYRKLQRLSRYAIIAFIKLMEIDNSIPKGINASFI